MKQRMALWLAVCLLALELCACAISSDNAVSDYYGECTFALPFRTTNSHSDGMLYFDVTMTLTQVCDAIVARGYRAELFESGPEDTLLITAMRDEKTYYFVIFDQDLAAEDDYYVLRDASLSWRSNDKLYGILAPIHIMTPTAEEILGAGGERIEVYRSFDYIAQFYRAVGREEIVIDQAQKTIVFPCHADETTGRVESRVTLRYTEEGLKQYLSITVEDV